MSNGILSLALVGAVALLGAGSPVQANLLTNGSFEAPVVPIGGYTDAAVGSGAIPGWGVVGASGNNVTVFNGSITGGVGGGVSFPAQTGVQWINLSRGINDPSLGVSQTIATTAGEIYQLSFFIGNTSNGVGLLGNTSTVNVSINGSATFSDTNATATTDTMIWQQFTHSFVASGASTTLAFLNGDAGLIDSGDSGADDLNGLDNIVLTATNVPEPASLALLGAALLGLAFRSKRPIY